MVSLNLDLMEDSTSKDVMMTKVNTTQGQEEALSVTEENEYEGLWETDRRQVMYVPDVYENYKTIST